MATDDTPGGGALYDCQRCGACCVSPSDEYGYVYLTAVESMRLRDIGLPVVTEETGAYLGTSPYYGAGGERICTAFDGRVGQCCGCSVYTDRPDKCRRFEVGGAGCRAARTDAGLPV